MLAPLAALAALTRKTQSSLKLAALSMALLGFGLACGFGSRVTDLTNPPTPTGVAPGPTPTRVVPDATPTSPPPSPTAAQSRPVLPIDSVVQIWTLDENDDLLWSGSGSIVSPDGYILTNAHVVLSDKYYTVYGLLVSLTVTEDEPPLLAYQAETVVVDEALDLAVIRIVSDVDGNPIDPETLNLPVMDMGNSDEVSLGSPLRILGYPGIGGETITLTSGEVAGFTNEPGVKGRAYIKTSATIAGGNSGGAGIDDQGRLIGVPTQLGYGGGDEIVDCRVLADTNGDGEVDSRDACVPTGGFINALRPINLAKPLIAQALSGEITAQTDEEAPPRSPISLPENPGQTLFSDDFSADDGQWSATDGLFISDGMLRLAVEQSGDYRYTILPDEFDAADVQVDTRKLSGPADNSFGLIFRYQDADNFYSFEISSDGFFVVNKLQDGAWSTLIDWTQSSVINTRSDDNQVAMVMQDDSYSFLVNGVQVGSVKDDSFSGGQIGLIASSYTEPQVLIGFDNLLARTPGGSRKMAVPDETPVQPGSVVYQDDFSTVDAGWNTESDTQIRRGVQDGEFFIAVDDDLADAWATHQTALGDAIIEVTAHKTAGPDTNNYGVMCRYQDPENYYFLQLGSDGTYAISRYLNGESTMLVDWTSSNEVHTGAEANLIRAECVGETLSLYANDSLLASVMDAGLKYGQIALAAGTYDDPGVQINFDDLTVTRPASDAAGDPLFYDDFSSNREGWPEEENAEANYFFSDGEYYIQVLETDYLVWSKMNETWSNVAIDVETRQTDGPANNEYGVLCRYQDADNFYQIAISGDGYYRLARWADGDFEEVITWEGSSDINLAGTGNHLSVVCAGNQIRLGVNGHLLFDTTDDALPTGGDVALYVGTFDEGGVTVAF